MDGATYTVDDAGNRATKLNWLNSVTDTYSYDDIYELTQVVQNLDPPATTESYGYDEVGNRLSSLGLSPYSYNTSNQLTSTPNATFTYDNNGNTLTKTDTDGETQYAWDYENRLTSVTLPDTSIVSLKYDPFGRRIQKISAAGTVNYVYDGANVVEEVTALGGVAARYVQGAGIDEPLAESRGGLYFYAADGLGSITSLMDSAGANAAMYTYDAFGKLTASSGSIANPYRYTAREYDDETGLYYYRARYYDSTVGRFTSEDPTGFQSGDIDFYAYVSNFPTGFVDPFGLVEGSPANLAKRKNIADTATGYENSHDFDFDVNGGWQYPRRSWKCSYFVCSVIRQAGAPIAIIAGGKARCATAAELANPRWNPKNWRVLKSDEQPLPGDIAAVSYPGHTNEHNPYTGHSAIVTPQGFTASHASGVSTTPAFSSDPTANIVYRRFTGD